MKPYIFALRRLTRPYVQRLADRDFSGVILDASATCTWGTHTRIEFAAVESLPVVLENNNYYLKNEIATRIAEQIARTCTYGPDLSDQPLSPDLHDLRGGPTVVHLSRHWTPVLRSLRAFVDIIADRREVERGSGRPIPWTASSSASNWVL